LEAAAVGVKVCVAERSEESQLAAGSVDHVHEGRVPLVQALRPLDVQEHCKGRVQSSHSSQFTLKLVHSNKVLKDTDEVEI